MLKPDHSVLDKHINPHLDTKYCIRFTCPEFTSICPVTSQPDFAKIIIDYIPNKFIVESKSLKLYLLDIEIMVLFMKIVHFNWKTPKQFTKTNWLRIAGIWYPRGGIPIDIFWQTKIYQKAV